MLFCRLFFLLGKVAFSFVCALSTFILNLLSCCSRTWLIVGSLSRRKHSSCWPGCCGSGVSTGVRCWCPHVVGCGLVAHCMWACLSCWADRVSGLESQAAQGGEMPWTLWAGVLEANFGCSSNQKEHSWNFSFSYLRSQLPFAWEDTLLMEPECDCKVTDCFVNRKFCADGAQTGTAALDSLCS